MNQRDTKEVLKYLEEENSYTDSVMKKTEALQDNFDEMKARIKQTDSSVSYEYESYFYYNRTVAKKIMRCTVKKKLL